jgi:molecular chaperone HtpG
MQPAAAFIDGHHPRVRQLPFRKRGRMSTTETSAGTSAPAPRPFQAEVSRLLHLMVHSVYSDREIFLRELISNASDACDKLRYEAIARPDLLGSDTRLAIRITPDKVRGLLMVSDNGIGMDAAELADNLGTIARSGTRAFLDKLKDAPQANGLIGQFGVGFYSAFMVADHIDVVSRQAGSAETWMWSSDGESGFTVAEAPPDRAPILSSGTTILLRLKPDALEFLEPARIERIVRTYSDHILFPVELADEKGQARQLNTASALWQRPKSEIKPEDYTQAYRTLAGAFDEPALSIHYKAEGRQAYAVLLFVPKQRPFDLYDVTRKGRVKLYVRRVFITDDADLLPPYLRFVKGVIDSEDVPLNISREMLQNNPLVAQIRKAVTTRVLAELETLSEKDAAAYTAIWDAFGAPFKEGLYEDFERREQLLKLARFRSTAGSGWRSLADYVTGMKPSQTAIYYLAGEDLDRLKASPQLEAAAARGVEVLLLADPIDHFWTASAPSFEGKPLKSLTQGDVDLTSIPLLDSAKAAEAPKAEQAKDLVAAIKSALGDRVSDVRVSQRLVSSAACLVAPGQGPDRGLERILARQDRGVGAKPVLEVNLAHPLLAATAGRPAEEIGDIAQLLLDQAHILEGEPPAEPGRFTEILNRLVLKGLAR